MSKKARARSSSISRARLTLDTDRHSMVSLVRPSFTLTILDLNLSLSLIKRHASEQSSQPQPGARGFLCMWQGRKADSRYCHAMRSGGRWSLSRKCSARRTILGIPQATGCWVACFARSHVCRARYGVASQKPLSEVLNVHVSRRTRTSE